MEERRRTKNIRIIHPVLIDGKHAPAGSIHSVSRRVAFDIIGSGCAAEHLEKGETPEPAPTIARFVDDVAHNDPKAQHGDPATTKRKVAS
jgi:hypothetical protein